MSEKPENEKELQLIVKAKNKTKAAELLTNCGLKYADELKYISVGNNSFIAEAPLGKSKIHINSNIGKKLMDNNILILHDARMDKYRKDIYDKYSNLEQNLRGLLAVVLSDLSAEYNAAALDWVSPRKARTADGEIKNNVEILCKLNLEELFNLLTTDYVTAFKKTSGVDALISILNDSKDFSDYKNKVKNKFAPKTIWEDVDALLKKHCTLEDIKGNFGTIISTRNDAAHSKNVFKENYGNFLKSYSVLMPIINSENINPKADFSGAFASALAAIEHNAKIYEETAKAMFNAISPQISEYQRMLDSIKSAIDATKTLSGQKYL